MAWNGSATHGIARHGSAGRRRKPLKERYQLRTEDYESAEEGGISLPLAGLLQEIFELYSRAMVNATSSVLLGLLDICPARMNVQGTGAALHNFMELNGLAENDLEEVALLLN